MSNNYEKEYDEILLYCYDNKHTNYKKIIECWEPSYPNLNIINGRNFGGEAENIIHHDNINQTTFENLFNRCGIHICLNEIDSYSHNIN